MAAADSAGGYQGESDYEKSGNGVFQPVYFTTNSAGGHQPSFYYFKRISLQSETFLGSVN